MTKHKGEKRAIRERMVKTGERYTTARHYHLALHRTACDVTPPADLAPASSSTVLAPPAAPADAIPAASERSVADDAPDVPAITSDPDNASAAGPLTAANASAEVNGVAGQSATGSSTDPGRGTDGRTDWVDDPGMSDEAIVRNTGRSWNEWFTLLDAWGAAERTHTEIARHLGETYPINGWWAQGVTVGYERARGRRKLYQRPEGFTISISKTVAVPAERLFAAFVDADLRDQWLEPGTLRERTSQPSRSARFDLVGTGSRVHITITARGDEKSMVQVEEVKLAGEDQVAPRKAFWKQKLSGLSAFLTA